jgi:hypothetical protein
MPLTDPHRSTVRRKLRPVIGDDSALEALMSQFPASPSDAPATKTDLATTEATLKVELAQLETRLTDKMQDAQMKLLAILLSFTAAYLAIAVGAVIAFA